MTKSQAKYIFRGTQKLADALGLSRQAIHKWPEQLPQRTIDLIVGASTRLDIRIEFPDDL